MNKKDFEEIGKIKAVVVSVDKQTEETLYNYYHGIKIAERDLERYKQDFPYMLHFLRTNKAVIKAFEDIFGVKESNYNEYTIFVK